MLKTEIWPSFYQDSVVLMRVAAEIRGRPGVGEAAAFMGTPSNQALLEQSGLSTAEGRKAGPNDLILTVAAVDAGAAAALAAAHELLVARRQSTEESVEVAPRTLNSALRLLPDANLATISVPGEFVKLEAMRALRRDLNVFIFSDNVPLEHEIALKREALGRGLLCMGPDCGTAYLNGTGLGFVNVVPKGRIGCVAASGTGLQAVASHLAALGEGISQGIGVGGRDLGPEVGGMMTLFALEALASDPATDAVVLISKPPHAKVMAKLEAALEAIEKPVVVCCLGAAGQGGTGKALWVETLDLAAEAVHAVLEGKSWKPRTFADPQGVLERLDRLRAPATPMAPGVAGFYTGGTLAHEARLLLQPLLGDAGFDGRCGAGGSPHHILDLGDDAYTMGRPHPMIDPRKRSELILSAGTSPEVGVLLFDLVLGKASHPDPAEPLATAVKDARATAAADGRRLLAVASVVGTAEDPQGLAGQIGQLEAAGVEVFPSNAEAVRFAALAVDPKLSARLLEEVQ